MALPARQSQRKQKNYESRKGLMLIDCSLQQRDYRAEKPHSFALFSFICARDVHDPPPLHHLSSIPSIRIISINPNNRMIRLSLQPSTSALPKTPLTHKSQRLPHKLPLRKAQPPFTRLPITYTRRILIYPRQQSRSEFLSYLGEVLA